MIRTVARVLVVVTGMVVFLVVVADEKGPLIPQASGDQCVADTALMRREHMDLMIHQRDDTVIRGIRGNPFSIVGCVNCHAQKDSEGKPVRIDAEGQFCQSCHAYAAVKIDCFTCHAAVPDQTEQGAGLGPGSELHGSLQ